MNQQGMQQYMSAEDSLRAFEESKKRVQLAARLVGVRVEDFDLLGNYVLIKVKQADFTGPEYADELIPQEFNSSLENYGEIIKLGVDANGSTMVVGFEVGDKIIFDGRSGNTVNRTGLFYDENDPEVNYFQVLTSAILGKLK